MDGNLSGGAGAPSGGEAGGRPGPGWFKIDVAAEILGLDRQVILKMYPVLEARDAKRLGTVPPGKGMGRPPFWIHMPTVLDIRFGPPKSLRAQKGLVDAKAVADRPPRRQGPNAPEDDMEVGAVVTDQLDRYRRIKADREEIALMEDRASICRVDLLRRFTGQIAGVMRNGLDRLLRHLNGVEKDGPQLASEAFDIMSESIDECEKIASELAPAAKSDRRKKKA